VERKTQFIELKTTIQLKYIINLVQIRPATSL